jgi:hypothetical protein
MCIVRRALEMIRPDVVLSNKPIAAAVVYR